MTRTTRTTKSKLANQVAKEANTDDVPRIATYEKRERRSADQIVRRIHLYLILFLLPWFLMYGVSAIRFTAGGLACNIFYTYQFIASYSSRSKRNATDGTRKQNGCASPTMSAAAFDFTSPSSGSHASSGIPRLISCLVTRLHQLCVDIARSCGTAYARKCCHVAKQDRHGPSVGVVAGRNIASQSGAVPRPGMSCARVIPRARLPSCTERCSSLGPYTIQHESGCVNY